MKISSRGAALEEEYCSGIDYGVGRLVGWSVGRTSRVRRE